MYYTLTLEAGLVRHPCDRFVIIYTGLILSFYQMVEKVLKVLRLLLAATLVMLANFGTVAAALHVAPAPTVVFAGIKEQPATVFCRTFM